MQTSLIIKTNNAIFPVKTKNYTWNDELAQDYGREAGYWLKKCLNEETWKTLSEKHKNLTNKIACPLFTNILKINTPTYLINFLSISLNIWKKYTYIALPVKMIYLENLMLAPTDCAMKTVA